MSGWVVIILNQMVHFVKTNGGIFHTNHLGRVSMKDYRNYLFIIFTLALALIFLKLKKQYKARIIKK